MKRREFLTAGAAAGLGSSAWARSLDFLGRGPRRVGLIGCGWYGKCDLLRLIQVAPVEVVSLCDVDQVMLKKAAELVASRQQSRKTPRTYSDYRELLREAGARGHARSLARAPHDRRH
jgi:ornithine cyclodeaminase/alanine dehydrogenase-like protein (mu-crystallin family)